MKKGKKAQFYIIAAFVIIAVIISLATVSNFLYVKREPQNFYNVGDILKLEGIRVIEYVNYGNQENLDNQISKYLDDFANYTEQNINEDFSFIVLYGNIDSGNISAVKFSRNSQESITISIGDTVFSKSEYGQLSKEQTEIRVNEGEPRTVTITLKDDKTGLTVTTKEVPILPDNNFAFVMTTSSNFTQYISESSDITI